MNEPDYKGFALAVMDDWPDAGMLDGFDLQELGEKFGLLKPQERTTFCEPECVCAEYFGPDQAADGFTCYRKVWVTDQTGHEL